MEDLLQLSLSRALAAAIVIAPALGTSRAQAQPIEQSAANAQYARAIEAIERKDYEEARRLLLELWQTSKTYDVAASLGQCEFKLRNYAAAAQYMTFSIANAPPMEDPDVVERFKRGLNEAKAHVGAVRIKAEPHPQRVTVDGTPIEVSTWPAEIFLNPGKHAIEAELGASAATRTLDVSAKGEYEVAFELAVSKPGDGSGATAQRAEPTTLPLSPDPGRTRSLAPVWIGSAVAVSGIAFGIAELVRASNAKDEASALREANGNGGCVNPPTDDLRASCSKQHDAVSRHDSALGWATGGFVVAGAAAVFTIGYSAWPAPRAASGVRTRPQVALLPSVSPRELGFSFVGSFE